MRAPPRLRTAQQTPEREGTRLPNGLDTRFSNELLRTPDGICLKGPRGTDAHSGWGRGRIRISLPVVSVAQAASGQGDEQQRRHAQADQQRKGTAVVGHHGSGKEPTHGPNEYVKGRVQQNGEEYAAFRIVEDPRKDYGHEDHGGKE